MKIWSPLIGCAPDKNHYFDIFVEFVQVKPWRHSDSYHSHSRSSHQTGWTDATTALLSIFDPLEKEELVEQGTQEIPAILARSSNLFSN